MTAPRPAITTAALTKTYGPVRAVSRLDLTVRSGEVFGFLGPNGAGKTTTIRMLLGLQRPSAGRATVLGMDPVRDAVAVHSRVGYLPGELVLFPHRSGRQLVEWFGTARGGVDPTVVQALVERFGAEMHRPVRDLSKGNRQKVGLVLTFMHRPELLILDEPSSGLDPLMQHEFELLVRETAAEGRTVFLSSHELDEVQRTADRVAIIRGGELVTEDTVAGLRRRSPQRVEARFPHPVDTATFRHLDGVRTVTIEDSRAVLEVAGRIGPLLRVIADLDPLEVTSHRAGLDELFLRFYGEGATGAATGASTGVQAEDGRAG